MAVTLVRIISVGSLCGFDSCAWAESALHAIASSIISVILNSA